MIKSSRERMEKRFELKQRVSIEDFKRNILSLNKMCAENGGKLILVSFTQCNARRVPPNKFGFGVPENHLEESLPLYRQAVEDVARENSIPFLVMPEMTEYADSPNAHLFIDVFHPNAAGHAVVMQRMYAFLADGGFLPADASNSVIPDSGAPRRTPAPPDQSSEPNRLDQPAPPRR
jgi:hypothetical protein